METKWGTEGRIRGEKVTRSPGEGSGEAESSGRRERGHLVAQLRVLLLKAAQHVAVCGSHRRHGRCRCRSAAAVIAAAAGGTALARQLLAAATATAAGIVVMRREGRERGSSRR